MFEQETLDLTSPFFCILHHLQTESMAGGTNNRSGGNLLLWNIEATEKYQCLGKVCTTKKDHRGSAFDTEYRWRSNFSCTAPSWKQERSSKSRRAAPSSKAFFFSVMLTDFYFVNLAPVWLIITFSSRGRLFAWQLQIYAIGFTRSFRKHTAAQREWFSLSLYCVAARRNYEIWGRRRNGNLHANCSTKLAFEWTCVTSSLPVNWMESAPKECFMLRKFSLFSLLCWHRLYFFGVNQIE